MTQGRSLEKRALDFRCRRGLLNTGHKFYLGRTGPARCPVLDEIEINLVNTKSKRRAKSNFARGPATV